MAKAKSNRVWSEYALQAYVLESYAGVEYVEHANGVVVPQRQFLYSNELGEVVIGNSAAFAIHLARTFGYQPNGYDFINVNKILLDAGERIRPEAKRARAGRVIGARGQEPKERPAE